MSKVLVIGACGQIGSELVLALRERHGNEQVWASDIRENPGEQLQNGPYKALDVMDRPAVESFIREEGFDHVYLLAALLSATAEKHPELAWKLNMEGLFTILDLAREGAIKRIFWPSSIAVFGPSTPSDNTPQETIMEPNTVYGISKLAGERWCSYYHEKHGVDVRSVRYPGLISHGSLPGGGTTDYAVDIFYHAKAKGNYSCFLSEKTALPMMYMDDAIRATLELMDADADKLKVRSSYNLSGLSFTPEEIAREIKKHLPDFQITYVPDFRQKIADSWPASIDDSAAREEWGWNAHFDLPEMVREMLQFVDEKKLFASENKG
ncbi:MAG: NAD-dependent epimerase/dehydratase family protein [Bacteroidetes bacterium]|nr:MAG: NAD-dependent epimerase/dehydratase family protein [Bacteroidota bacterium]